MTMSLARNYHQGPRLPLLLPSAFSRGLTPLPIFSNLLPPLLDQSHCHHPTRVALRIGESMTSCAVESTSVSLAVLFRLAWPTALLIRHTLIHTVASTAHRLISHSSISSDWCVFYSSGPVPISDALQVSRFRPLDCLFSSVVAGAQPLNLQDAQGVRLLHRWCKL